MTGLIEGQWYAYRIRAFNKLGASRPCRATDEIQAVDARGRAAVSGGRCRTLSGSFLPSPVPLVEQSLQRSSWT